MMPRRLKHMLMTTVYCSWRPRPRLPWMSMRFSWLLVSAWFCLVKSLLTAFTEFSGPARLEDILLVFSIHALRDLHKTFTQIFLNYVFYWYFVVLWTYIVLNVKKAVQMRDSNVRQNIASYLNDHLYTGYTSAHLNGSFHSTMAKLIGACWMPSNTP